MQWDRFGKAPQLHHLALFLAVIVASCASSQQSGVDLSGARDAETAIYGPATPSSILATGPPLGVRLLAIPTASVATWTPIPAEELEQLRNVGYPVSELVEMGKYYEFSIYTHCRADFNVDFDGSLWQVNNREAVPWGELDDPFQDGWMILIDENYARFEFQGGSILYIRHEGPQQLPGCE